MILILKEIPHLLGHDTDPMGEMSFNQPDKKTTFGELREVFDELMSGGDQLHPGAIVVGLSTLALLLTLGSLETAEEIPRAGSTCSSS